MSFFLSIKCRCKWYKKLCRSKCFSVETVLTRRVRENIVGHSRTSSNSKDFFLTNEFNYDKKKRSNSLIGIESFTSVATIYFLKRQCTNYVQWLISQHFLYLVYSWVSMSSSAIVIAIILKIIKNMISILRVPAAGGIKGRCM